MSLKEDLGQLLVSLSPRTRSTLEKKCLIDTHPLQLFTVLSDATATVAVRQLAGVLLAKQIPSYWSLASVSERLKLQSSLLVALDSDCDGAVVRSLVDCTACLANCLAMDGVAWQDLFLWMRGIASETSLTNSHMNHSNHSNHSSSFSSSGYSSSLHTSQSIRKRRAFLYLLDRLLESAPWRAFLEPHVMEISELLYRMAMSSRHAKGDGVHVSPGEEFACSKHALECLGSLASVVRGEEDAQVFHYQIVKVLLSHEIIGSELCESALEALSRAAAADELLIADTSFYNPGLAPEDLCPAVRLGLSASVTQRGQRRILALRLLHSIADSHSRLLCTSRNGQLSAEEVLRTLIEDVAPDEVRLKSFDADGPFPVEAASAAEWGAEYALLARISKRMPDKLIFPVIYRFACRSLTGTDVPVKLAAFAALRAVLVGCMASVKKQLQRIARLVLRALMDSQLQSVTFVLIADLCAWIPAETRCGSCRLAERLLPPLLQQLQMLQLRDPVFPRALGALEAAYPQPSQSGKRFGLFPVRPQSGVVAIAWTGQKLEELLTQCHLGRHETSPIWDGMASRLCKLLTALVQRQPLQRPPKRDKTAVLSDLSFKELGSKIAIVLHRILVANVFSESRSMALEASGAWIKISADMGLQCQELQDLFNISLHAAEVGLKGSEHLSVTPDAAIRFVVSLGSLAPSPGAAFVAGLEQCARMPTPTLLQALASLASTQGLLLGIPEGRRLANLLVTFLEQPHLRGPAADLARSQIKHQVKKIVGAIAWELTRGMHLPLSKQTVVLLVLIAKLLDHEERPDVFCSLCMAAAHMAAQEGEPQGELSEALQLLRTVVERLQQKSSMRSRGALPENSDQESTDVSECESTGSEQSAPTVASTADLEGAGVDRALHTLCQTLGLAQ